MCISELQSLTIAGNHENFNWQKHAQVKRLTRGGEALLLADLVRKSTGLKVLSPVIDKENREELIHSLAEIGLFPKQNKKDDLIYRVGRD